ncbi:MAG: glycosyltransferase family 2 protein [Opitutus sp.]
MSTSTTTVDVLLGTYNGARFLPEQLTSLENQTFRNWRLIARDDGSSDATRAVLADFKARHPNSVILVEGESGRLGSTGNFGRLLAESTADFGLFCDQDDVWQPNKIEQLLALAEEHSLRDAPLLVHSDLEVVDRDLHLVAPSLWRYQFIRPANCRTSRLLVQNVVTGCACLFNAALRRAALPIPPEAIQHDWWLALVASAAGKIRWTNVPLVRYRQHGDNDTGAKAWNPTYLRNHARQFFQRGAFQKKILAYQRQAEALIGHPSFGLFSFGSQATVRDFATMGTRRYPGRVGVVLRHRILKTGVLRNLALLARI